MAASRCVVFSLQTIVQLLVFAATICLTLPSYASQGLFFSPKLDAPRPLHLPGLCGECFDKSRAFESRKMGPFGLLGWIRRAFKILCEFFEANHSCLSVYLRE